MEWVVEKKHDLVLLLLDFEKAFDHIEHRFFVQSLGKALGFYHKWIKWTFSLYGLASLA
jgi:hypothetical protein